MSGQKTYPRQALERISDRKKRKLAIDDSDEIAVDSNLHLLIDPELEVVEDSQTSLKGHRDLFGDLIVHNPVKKVETNNKSTKKKPVSRKKKEPPKEVIISPIIRPQRVFIPTPKIIKIMQEAQKELYDLMGIQTSSSDVSVVTTDDLNVSGIQNLQDSPSTNKRNESSTNANNNDNTNSRQILEGVVGFVDYKVENDRSGSSIIKRLLELGAKVEKTFNRKVTHVVFCDGYRTTYNIAMERNVPLVSARWIEYSASAKKILDPKDYPPNGMEKYKEPIKIKYLDIPVSDQYKKYLRPSNAIRDQLFKDTCDNLIERFHNINAEHNYKNSEHNGIIETPKKTTVIQEKNHCKSDILDKIYMVLNTSDSCPVPDDQIDELCIPMSIKVLRKCLTPSEKENTTPTELDSELAKIEDRLNLNSQARKRFRQLLFPPDKDTNNTSNTTDFPSPSPQKLRISAPSRLISTRKKKTVINNKLLPDTNKLDNDKKTPPEKNVQRNLLKWQIPSDLRPKKIKKPTVPKVRSTKKTQSQDTASSMISRNSSRIFQTPKDSLASPIVLQSVACTGMTKNEVNIIKSSVLNLGYNFHPKVEPLTTYLVTKPQPNRTLNTIFAMAYGCFIVSEDWVYESLKVGRWLSHEKYLISDLSEPVKEFQMRRHTFGSLLTFHIFDNVGRIYISDTSEPAAKLLKRLVRACGGHCTSIETKADVVIGNTQQMNNNIHEKWILDSITQGTLLDKYQYMLSNINK